jgi:1,5-anhydro-D-fructose reductase (1,5-anhydro-D-mannitol-forming)
MAGGWAIVGTGSFAGRRIAPALNRALGCRLVAVVSRDRTRAEEFAAEHGAPRAYDDVEAAVRDRDISYVWVATPHALHLEPVLAAARAGKHVLCEKPLAGGRADAREMIRTCRRFGVQLGTGFHLRHHPLHQEARRLVADGALGGAAYAEAEWSIAARRAVEGSPLASSQPPSWRTDPALAIAGILVGTGIHAIDLLRFVLDDEVAEATALTDSTSSPMSPLEMRAVVLLRFSRGTLAFVRCMRNLVQSENSMRIGGTTARLDALRTLDEAARGSLVGIGVEPAMAGVPAGTDLYALQATAFVQATESGQEPSASGEDGLRMVEVLDAVLESSRTGRTISLG